MGVCDGAINEKCDSLSNGCGELPFALVLVYHCDV